MTTDTTASTATEEEAKPTETETTQDVTTDSQQTGQAETVETLPGWAQKVIKDARTEAAKYRIEKTESEKAAEQAATEQAEKQGEYQRLYEEIKVQFAEANQMAETEKLLRLKAEIAHKLNLPGLLAERLQGETLEELEADAQVLLDAMPKVQPVTATDANAGVNGRQVTPTISDEQIREKAARLNVSYEQLRKQYVKE